MPEGLRWNYIPLSEIQLAEEGVRVLPGGHCNPFRAKKPKVDITAEEKQYQLPLDHPESVEKILAAIKK